MTTKNAVAFLAALAVVLACAPARAELRTRTRDLGATSTPSGVLDWSRSWAEDWTTGASTPTPDVECVSAGSGGDLTCTGATATKSGNPTTVGAPGYPARTAVRLDGTGDWYDLPASTGALTALTTCVTFTAATPASVLVLAAKNDGSTNTGWQWFTSGGALQFVYFKGASASAGGALNVGSLVAGTWYVSCVSINATGADGSGVLSGNTNGVAPTPVTNGGSPIYNPNIVTVIGSRASHDVPWNGDVANFTLYRGWAASAAELAALVASQQARLASKPLGALVTVTSGATTCDSRSDGSLYSLPAGSLCCGASGCEIWGAAQHSNLLTYSNTFENAAWTKDTGTSVADASASCPIGPLGTAMALFTADGDGEGISQDAATGTGRGIWLAYATGGSACNVTLSDASGDGGAAVALTGTPTLFKQAAAGQTGIKVAKPAGGCATWCQQAAVVQASLVVGPYSPTAGTPFTGAADVPSRPVADDVTDAKGCVGARFTYPAVQESNARVLGFTAGGTPLYLQSATSIGMYDGSAARSLTVPSMAGRQIEAASCWSGNTATIYSLTDGLSASVAYDGAFIHATRILYVGSDAGNVAFLNSKVKTVCQGKDIAAIRDCFRR